MARGLEGGCRLLTLAWKSGLESGCASIHAGPAAADSQSEKKKKKMTHNLQMDKSAHATAGATALVIFHRLSRPPLHLIDVIAAVVEARAGRVASADIRIKISAPDFCTVQG